MRADRRLYLDRYQSRLLEANHPDIAWLLAGKGQEIPDAEVKRLGLTRWSDGRVMQGPEPAPLAAEPVVEPPPAVEPVAGLTANTPPEPIMPPQVTRSRRRRS